MTSKLPSLWRCPVEDVKETYRERIYGCNSHAVASGILRSVLVGILAGAAMPAWSQESNPRSPSIDSSVQAPATVHTLDIPRLPLKQALTEFCHQTGLLYGQMPESPAEETVLVGPLKGRFTAVAALNQLLIGTGLAFDWTTASHFSVGRRSMAKIPRNGGGVDGQPRGELDHPRSELHNRPSTAAAAARDERRSSGPGDERDLESVTVTDSRLPRRARGSERPTQVTVFDRAKIERLGVFSVGDLLKYVSQQPYTRPEGARISGAQYAEMRGIGVDTTSILINGRRVMPSASNLASNAFDLNTIPLVAVKRIEVLSDSASAVYGADAIGGVVNIILEDDIPDPVLAMNYGWADGGADEQRVSLSAGYSNERLKATLVFDYADRSFLLGEKRDRWRNQDFQRFGSIDQRSLNTNPGNISSPGPANLPELPSRFAAVPNGSTGLGLTPADFLATAGVRNRDSLHRYFTIVPEAVRGSAVGSVELSLTPGVTAIGELLYVNQSSLYQIDPPSLNAIVPATNAFNPFEAPVAVNYLLSSVGPRQLHIDTELFRAMAGMRGQLGSWHWDLSFLRMAEEGTLLTRNALDPVRVNAALASPDPAQALNVFQDGPGGSPELLASLVAPALRTRNSSESAQGGGFLSGPLFTMPTGVVDVVIGGEWRREKVLFEDTVLGSQVLGSHHRLISAAFAEARVPLVNRQAAPPLMKELSLSIATRLDDYSDFGSTFNPRYGLVWRPVANLALRASYGNSFRPPSMLELFTPRIVLPGQILDPRRNNEAVVAQVLTGGNSALKPVDADSLTTGFVFTPVTFNDLEFAASYWRIHMRNRVTTVPLSSLLMNEALFPERVIRNEPTPAEVAAGLPGTLAFVDLSRTNFGRLQTSGVDIGASIAVDSDLGRFTPSVSATWVRDFSSEDLPSTAPVERVGVADPLGTIARWRVIATLGWQLNGLSLSATARYVPHYADASPLAGRNGRTIPSQTIVDAQASVDLEEALGWGPYWRGLKLTAGVTNLFDEEPNFAEVGSVIGFDMSQGDLKQRYGYINITRKF